MQPLVLRINALEPAMRQLSDEQLRAKTDGIQKTSAGRRNAR